MTKTKEQNCIRQYGTKKEKTYLLNALIIGLILYTAYNFDPLSFIGIINFSLIGVIVLITHIRINTYKLVLFLYLAITYLCIHLYLSKSSISIILLSALMIVFNICLLYYDINYKSIGKLLLLISLLNALLGINQILHAPFTNNPNEFFTGIFRNPNTCAIFGCCMICSVTLFIRNKKYRILAILVFCLYLIGCKSRNSLLFTTSSIIFYYMLNNIKLSKFTIPCFIIIIISSLIYLIIIEPMIGIQEITVMGKEGGSAGRSEQILLTINSFPLKFFGIGANLPNENSIMFTRYPVHNMFINSIYGMGIGMILLYVTFCVYLFRNIKSIWAKSFLLSFNIYFLFEPGITFGSQMATALPIILLTLEKSKEKYENMSYNL